MSEIAVLGAGLMGHALALVFALGGHKVRFTDSNPEALRRAPGLMETALATLLEAGEVEPSWNAERLAAAEAEHTPECGIRGSNAKVGGNHQQSDGDPGDDLLVIAALAFEQGQQTSDVCTEITVRIAESPRPISSTIRP